MLQWQRCDWSTLVGIMAVIKTLRRYEVEIIATSIVFISYFPDWLLLFKYAG